MIAIKRSTTIIILQLIFVFSLFSQSNYDSTTTLNFTDDTKANYKERKGFALNIGLGYGYTSFYFNIPSIDSYGISGLNLDFGMGFYASPHSRILFNIKSNIFISEVNEVYSKWLDKMSGDDLKAVGAKLISPFVFGLSPWARSHLMFPSVEYTYFLNRDVPSFFFKGCLGVGIIYDRLDNYLSPGWGVAAGAGYEFINNLGCHAEVMYMKDVDKTYLQAVTVLIGLDLIIH